MDSIEGAISKIKDSNISETSKKMTIDILNLSKNPKYLNKIDQID